MAAPPRARWSADLEPLPAGPAKRARAARRSFLVVLAAVVVAGAAGLLGVRTVERTARGGGHELTVAYASVARGGLAAPWSLTVRRDGGFVDGETLRVRLGAAYFDLFDENGFSPDAESSTSDGRYLVQEYEVPDGDTFELSYDARIGPSVQAGERGSAAVLDEDGNVIVEVSFRTWIMP